MIGIVNVIKNKLSNEGKRLDFVRRQLQNIPQGSLLLDAGCGSQRYRKYCDHLDYRAQDFGKYVADAASGFTSSMGGVEGYKYGELDYVGDIWAIEEEASLFDAILCTEVFEHIPFPCETLKEFSRLLKPGGKLILTVPSNCLRHMDPFFYYTGFSDHWLNKFCLENGLRVESLDVVGDYYSWIGVELARTIKNHSIISSIFLLPAMLYYLFQKPTKASRNTLCMGYHVTAIKSID